MCFVCKFHFIQKGTKYSSVTAIGQGYVEPTYKCKSPSATNKSASCCDYYAILFCTGRCHKIAKGIPEILKFLWNHNENLFSQNGCLWTEVGKVRIFCKLFRVPTLTVLLVAVPCSQPLVYNRTGPKYASHFETFHLPASEESTLRKWASTKSLAIYCKQTHSNYSRYNLRSPARIHERTVWNFDRVRKYLISWIACLDDVFIFDYLKARWTAANETFETRWAPKRV